MAVLMFMHWKGVTPDQYDKVRSDVDWEGDYPTGAIFHAASFGDGALHVVDIWQSEGEFRSFLKERLNPATERAGIAGQPDVAFYKLHTTFNPGVDRL